MEYKEAILFEPSGRDMKLDYPDLAAIEEFEKLSTRELKFVWYVGNRTSPLAKMGKRDRLKKAASLAWGGYHAQRDEVTELASGKIPDKILKAIDRMSRFSPSVRLKAKFMQEYIFEQMQSIILLTPQEMNEMDADERKKYVDLSLKVSSEIPELVERMESGEAVKVKEEDRKGKAKVKKTVSDVIDKLK